VIGCRKLFKDFSKDCMVHNKESDQQTIIMDPLYSERPDPDPYQAINVRNRIRICIFVKGRIRIRIKVKEGAAKAQRVKREPWRLPWTGQCGPCRLTLEPQGVCRLVAADSRHVAEEPDPSPHQNETWDPDPHLK
jgi:hypothetical protein